MVVRKAATFVPVKAGPLPPLPKLRIRNPNANKADPCTAMLSLVLSCYASLGQSTVGCQKFEEDLKKCVDNSKTLKNSQNNINYHLARLYPQIRPNMKQR